MNQRIQQIKTLLNERLNPSYLDIIDESHKHAGHHNSAKNGGHFKIIIVSACFTEQSLLKRHRMIYSALDKMLNTDIHALSINALNESEHQLSQG